MMTQKQKFISTHKIKNRSGKASTVFFIIGAVLLLALNVITFFYFHKEYTAHEHFEKELIQVRRQKDELQAELQSAGKRLFVAEEKNKESDEKINSLMDEVELEQGLRQELKKEVTTLKEEARMYQNAAAQAQESLETLKQRLADVQRLYEEEKSYRTAQETGRRPGPAGTGRNIQGTITLVDKANSFIIFDAGEKTGIQKGMTLAVYRGDQYLGNVTVSRVEPDFSAADFAAPLHLKKDDVVRLN